MEHGLRFRNVDLHVHTPASRCFIEPNVTPQDIVNQALAVGMEAIAITDHNSAAWVDNVKAAAQDTGLTVFPGVEITVNPGVHVVALFPEEHTGEHITDLLAELGIGVEQRGNSEAMVTRYGVQEVIAIIRRHGALPVLAHIDDVKGVWQELKGQTLIQLWQEAAYAAVEIIGKTLPEPVGRPPYMREPAFYWASDNPHPEQPTKHSHLGIGARYSCFKLDDPITWEGLRQCFDDPEVRIHRGRPTDAVHPLLERIRIMGGFLDGFDVALNQDLNCIIGGRGTGKSALLEIVRYAFDVPIKTTENARQSQSLLDYAFPIGARVTVDFKVGNVHYRVERIAGRGPKTFRGGVSEKDWIEIDVPPVDLLPLQVYGQKEIYQISLDPEFQLYLLDHYVAEALKPLKEVETRLLRELRANADQILRLEESVAASQEWVARLGAIEEEIRRMEALGFVERIKAKELYDREKRLLDKAEGQIQHWMNLLQELLQKEPLIDPEVLAIDEMTDLPSATLLQEQRQLLVAANDYLKQQLILTHDGLAQHWANGSMQRAAWQTAYAAQDKAYLAVLQEFAAEGQIGPDRYIQLQQRKAELEARAREVKQQQTQIQELAKKRKQWLADLRDVRYQQYQERCKKAEKLTEALKLRDKKLGSVRIRVEPQGNRQVYKEYLRELFTGLNVREPKRSALAAVKAAKPEREAQQPIERNGETYYLVPEIPYYLDPIDLAEAIRSEQERADEAMSLLEQRFGVDSDAMRRNIASLSRHQLFELEVFRVPDLPVIELQVETGLAGFRPLERLSVGQKCTALLSMVLIESNVPLLIDQPEDDLDNQFIFDQIVTTLRGKKGHRQFLIATHNANIPVSGDAELIMVLDADQAHGQLAPEGIASIEVEAIKKYVTRILEGGSDAFKIRKEKYGKLVEE